MHYETASRLAAMIRERRLSSAELLEIYIRRLERHNPTINAVVVTCLDQARARAAAADSALSRGESWGPLHGLPMTVKESFDVAGLPTTFGLPELKHNIAAGDAAAVERLQGAGAIIFGKTNVPLLLADWQTFNEIYGTTGNPWEVALVPGGSSGGSAAALAAGLTGLEIGSDIGGSIRNPAHYCGVYGHKPTYGIASPRGQARPGIVAASDLSVVGPLGRGADDLLVALEAMIGADGADAAVWRLQLPPVRAARLSGYRVALLRDHPRAAVDDSIQDALQRLADFLARQGATVDDRARPDIDLVSAHRIYLQLLRSATSRNHSSEEIGRFTEIVRGLPAEDESYRAAVMRGATLSHRDWLAANEQRHRLRLRWQAFFRDYDLLLCPAASSAAFPHDQARERPDRTILVNGKEVPSTDQLFWAGLATTAYLPATVAPLGQTAAGLPLGVQIVGPQYGDLDCIAFARHLEHEFRAFQPPPGFD